MADKDCDFGFEDEVISSGERAIEGSVSQRKCVKTLLPCWLL